MMPARIALSRLMISANSGRVIGVTTRPSAREPLLDRRIVEDRGDGIADLGATSGAGVAAGANTPSQDDISKPGIVSPMVGTSGIAA